MTESIENESNQKDLEGLPPEQRKETEEILAELSPKEEKPEDKNTDTSKSEEDKSKKEDTKSDDKDDKKEEDKKSEDEDASKKTRRDTKLLPAWQVAIERKKDAEKIEELTKKIDDLSKAAKPENGQQTTVETKKELAERVKELVEQSKVDVAPEFIEAIIKIAQEGREMPKEITDRLAEVDRLKAEAEIEKEELGFSKDFDAIVIPLIKAEYGDDIEPEKIAELKEKLKGIAYDPAYAKIPYDEIYQGKKDFRNFVTPKTRSAEGHRTTVLGVGEGPKDWTTLTEEEAKALPPEDFEKWSNAMAASERAKK